MGWEIGKDCCLYWKSPGFLIVVCPDPSGTGDDVVEFFTDDGWEKSLLARVRIPTGNDHAWLDPQKRAMGYPSVPQAIDIAMESIKKTLLKVGS